MKIPYHLRPIQQVRVFVPDGLGKFLIILHEYRLTISEIALPGGLYVGNKPITHARVIELVRDSCGVYLRGVKKVETIKAEKLCPPEYHYHYFVGTHGGFTVAPKHPVGVPVWVNREELQARLQQEPKIHLEETLEIALNKFFKENHDVPCQ